MRPISAGIFDRVDFDNPFLSGLEKLCAYPRFGAKVYQYQGQRFVESVESEREERVKGKTIEFVKAIFMVLLIPCTLLIYGVRSISRFFVPEKKDFAREEPLLEPLEPLNEVLISIPVSVALPIAEEPLLEEQIDLASQQAAIKVQALFRSFFLKNYLLPEILFQKNLRKFEKAPLNLEHTRAKSGNTPVWFPKDHPAIIMKFSGKSSDSRLKNMNRVRKLLKMQRSSHAIVPRARVYKRGQDSIIVEERLMINENRYYNMWLYLHNYKAFDNVVRELVQLYSNTGGPSDLCADRRYHPLDDIDGVSFGIRFDNFPLYLNKKGKGCVGLIDIEDIDPFFENACQILTRIFPYQSGVILEEAKKCGRPLKVNSLKHAQFEGKEALFKGIYWHEKWLEDKIKRQSTWVDTSNPIISLTKERKIEMIALVKKILLDGYNSGNEIREAYTLDEELKILNFYKITSRIECSDIKSLYNPIDTKVDLEWIRKPTLDSAHPEISVETLSTHIVLVILEYFAKALQKKGDILSFKTSEQGKKWKIIEARSPKIYFDFLRENIRAILAAHKKYIKETFANEEMFFPKIKEVDLVDGVMNNLISYGDIFSCDLKQQDYYWFRY